MRRRILLHSVFWIIFIAIHALLNMGFAGPSDLKYPLGQRYLRFFLNELAFLAWKMLPFYGFFYLLLPRYDFRKKGFTLSLGLLFLLLLSVIGFRLTITPVSKLMYNEIPQFQLFSPERLLYSLLEILPAVTIAGTLKLLKQKLASQRREEQLEKEKLEAELQFLKAQTNPHFLFNTLNNLYGLARRKDDNTAPSIMKLANIMRYILYECTSDFIAISKEIKIIEDYLDLEQLRYDKQVQITFDPVVDDPNQQITPLLLLPFIENAFKHGISEARKDAFLNIQLALSKGQLWFQVANNNNQHTPITTGIGLNNIQRQLELCYPQKHNLEFSTDAAQFLVTLMINLKEDER